MIARKMIGSLCLFLFMTCSLTRAQDSATQPSTLATTAPQDPSTPVPRTDKSARQWMDLHQSFLTRKSQGPIGVVFLGDSITANWTKAGKDVWEKEYGDYQAADFGIGGDRTQWMLWRIDNGEFDDLHPQATVLMMGTNNLTANSAEEIAAADTKIVHEVLDKTGSKVLLLGIFPRNRAGDRPDTMDKIKQINDALSKLDNGNTVRYLDIGKVFLGPDGKVPVEIMKDGLHPTAIGYQRWADAMRPLFDQMVKKPTSQPAQ